MSKSDLIRGLLAEGKSTARIASEVGCSTAYVRAIRNRARNTQKYSRSQSPKEVATANAYRRMKWKTNAEFRKVQTGYRDDWRRRMKGE